jgi:hypothetical protein
MTCSELISFCNVSYESDSASCTYMVETFAPICCPTVPENPCASICPDGASAGDDLAPYAEGGFLLTCKELIELDALYEAGSQEACSSAEIDASYCCPTAPENPCTICPGGATAGDDFVPFSGFPHNCMELIAQAKRIENSTSSGACKFQEGYEISCCPASVEETSPEIDGGTTNTTTANQ